MTYRTTIPTFSIALLALAGAAHAELGGNANATGADPAGKATQQVTDTAFYTLHELQQPSGLLVREYTGADGKVFAVAWEGPELPDLKRLLGPYFERYSDAVRQRGGRGSLSIALPDLVVQSGGHMRSFSGRAYLPEQMPDGVTPAGIQ